MNKTEKEELRRRLLQYPDVTEENVDEQIFVYEQRQEEKQGLIEERGFSNALAESYLERKGYPRPPGWHSVFFYPGSNHPRNSVIFWLAVMIGIVWFVIS